jgi:hypothetical protein
VEVRQLAGYGGRAARVNATNSDHDPAHTLTAAPRDLVGEIASAALALAHDVVVELDRNGASDERALLLRGRASLVIALVRSSGLV